MLLNKKQKKYGFKDSAGAFDSTDENVNTGFKSRRLRFKNSKAPTRTISQLNILGSRDIKKYIPPIAGPFEIRLKQHSDAYRLMCTQKANTTYHLQIDNLFIRYY